MTEYHKKGWISIYIGQLALLAVLSAGWWGILYPNIAMTEETFQAVSEDGQGDDTVSGTESFFAMLEAEPGEVIIKSRAADAISKWSAERGEKRTEKALRNGEQNENEQKRPDRGI